MHFVKISQTKPGRKALPPDTGRVGYIEIPNRNRRKMSGSAGGLQFP